MGIKLVKGDITKLEVDAIVNAANSSLLGGGGVDGAIHRVAGPKLLEECKTLGGCPVGGAKITKGYDLPAKYVIHTVGPVYHGKPNDAVLLSSCYAKCLDLARKNSCRSIAFPGISTGVYGYPVAEAAKVSYNAVDEWLLTYSDYDIDVFFCCFSDEAFAEYEKLLKR